MRKEKEVICLECKKKFKTKWTNKFCGMSCASTHNNRLRAPLSEEKKRKRSESLKRWWNDHPELKSTHKQRAGEFTKGKHGGQIHSIMDVSKRTASKILKRLNLGCCICKWNEASCDIHHINGKKVEDANGHWNLTCICPNHHRMIHNHKISKDKFISLDKYFPENWRDTYYG